MTVQPHLTYNGTLEHLLEECELAKARLETFRERGTSRFAQDGLSRADVGSAVDSVASVADLEYALTEQDRTRFKTLRDRIDRKCTAADEQGVELRLQRLVETFDLQPLHRDILVIALLPDIDPEGGELVSKLLDEELFGLRPTVGLCADLVADSPAAFVSAVRVLFEESPLVENGLLTFDQPNDPLDSALEEVVAVEDRIRLYVLGCDDVDLALQTHLEGVKKDQPLTIEDADGSLEDLLLDVECQATLEMLPNPDGRGRRVYFYGPQGAGMERAAAAVCEDSRYLRADLRAVLEASALEALVREARVLGLPLVLNYAHQAVADQHETDHSLEAVVRRFADFDAGLYLIGGESWIPANHQDIILDAICEFPRPSIAQRRQFWESHADDLPEDLEPETMASTFDLTLGQLEAALATADSLAEGEEPTIADIREGCRAQSSGDLGELSQHIEPTKTWDDIKLDERTETRLRKLESHITNRGTIYEDWGFRERDGNAGIVALFKGLPGTGKTLGAEVLANAVGMDIYKIDLSSVVSKYIGETEENLEQIFQAAEQSNAILLFDEADSIFGDRAEVSDASDRYANVEVNYLLQRVETYDGIILLTTNYAQNIDTAFARRITHSITFREPDTPTQQQIWETIFPADCPTEDIDTEWLAGFDYSGGQINKLAKHIAIYVADAGEETITQRHIVEALEQYKRDHNSQIREKEFEPYLEYLAGPTELEKRRQRQRTPRN